MNTLLITLTLIALGAAAYFFLKSSKKIKDVIVKDTVKEFNTGGIKPAPTKSTISETSSTPVKRKKKATKKAVAKKPAPNAGEPATKKQVAKKPRAKKATAKKPTAKK
jgi:hypothetical protein